LGACLEASKGGDVFASLRVCEDRWSAMGDEMASGVEGTTFLSFFYFDSEAGAHDTTASFLGVLDLSLHDTFSS
jgi:hypothetical protein